MFWVQDTSELILANLVHKNVEMEYLKLLRERHLGDLEFGTWDLFKNKGTEMDLPPHKHYQVDIPNEESFEMCKERAGQFFSKIVDVFHKSPNEREDQNILVVTHGSYIFSLFEYLLEHPAHFELVNFTENHLKGSQGNTARTRFSISSLEDSQVESSNSKAPLCLTFSHVFDLGHLA